MIKRPYCLVNRPPFNNIPVWQLIREGETILCKSGDGVKVFATEKIDLDNGIIEITNIKTDEKYSLTSNHDCRNFNIYWILDNEYVEGVKNGN